MHSKTTYQMIVEIMILCYKWKCSNSLKVHPWFKVQMVNNFSSIHLEILEVYINSNKTTPETTKVTSLTTHITQKTIKQLTSEGSLIPTKFNLATSKVKIFR